MVLAETFIYICQILIKNNLKMNDVLRFHSLLRGKFKRFVKRGWSTLVLKDADSQKHLSSEWFSSMCLHVFTIVPPIENSLELFLFMIKFKFYCILVNPPKVKTPGGVLWSLNQTDNYDSVSSCSNSSWKDNKFFCCWQSRAQHLERRNKKSWTIRGEKKEEAGSADPFSPSVLCLDMDKAGLERFPDGLPLPRRPQHVLWMKLFHRDSLLSTSSFSQTIPSPLQFPQLDRVCFRERFSSFGLDCSRGAGFQRDWMHEWLVELLKGLGQDVIIIFWLLLERIFAGRAAASQFCREVMS